MLAYIGISCIAVTILIGGIRWAVAKAGYRFPRLFWLYCLAAVLTVCILLPRIALGLMGVSGSLLLSFALLCALALWLATAFGSQATAAAFTPLQARASQSDSATALTAAACTAAVEVTAASAAPQPDPNQHPASAAISTDGIAGETTLDDSDTDWPLFAEDSSVFAAALREAVLPAPPLESTAPIDNECPLPAAKADLAEATPGDDMLPASDELDDLLDFALAQRADRRFDKALAAIQSAIMLYGEKDIDSLPYLILELAAIHKDQGDYAQAIQALAEGSDLLPRERFLAWREQFLSSIRYLEFTCAILAGHHQPLVPPEQIPAAIQAEIEEAYLAWNRSHQPS